MIKATECIQTYVQATHFFSQLFPKNKASRISLMDRDKSLNVFLSQEPCAPLPSWPDAIQMMCTATPQTGTDPDPGTKTQMSNSVPAFFFYYYYYI